MTAIQLPRPLRRAQAIQLLGTGKHVFDRMRRLGVIKDHFPKGAKNARAWFSEADIMEARRQLGAEQNQ